jgi:hypothetical protein
MKFNLNQSIHRVISLGPSELYKKIVWRVARRLKVFLFKTKKHPLNLTEKSIDDRISFVNLSYLTQCPFETNKKIIDKADDICRNKFHIHEIGCISWDTKTIPWDTWEPLNVRLFHRHDFLILLVRAFNLTQSHKYRDCIKNLLPDLIRHYPIDMIMRYDKTIDIAIRILNWSAICSLTGENVWSKNHLNYWLLQIEWMKANLSPGGNHRLIEGVGLFAAGLYFGEFSNAKKWKIFGKEIILKEMERQVFEDGIHAEQSFYYHIVCTTLFLKFYLLCKKANIKIDRNFSNRLKKMLEYVAYSQKPNGKHPMIGDGCEIGEIYEREHWEGMALLPALNQLFNKGVIIDDYQRDAFGWFMEPTPIKNNDSNNSLFNLSSNIYEKSGHAIFQNNSGQYLYFNCGPFGFPPHPHHGHADALSVEICLNYQDLILDSGGYAYRKDKYRQYVRGTSIPSQKFCHIFWQFKFLCSYPYALSKITLHGIR